MARRLKHPRRFRWLIIYLLLSATTTVIALAVVGAATCRPSWYAPAAIDRSRLNEDKRELARLFDQISAALNADESIEFELPEDRLNRWLVERAELWPGWQVDIEGLTDPQVNLLPGDRIRLAATASRGPVTAILSAVGRFELTPNELLIHVEAVRSGELPVLRSQVLKPLGKSLPRESDGQALLAGDTLRIRNEWVWQNGKRPFRVGRLEIRDQTAYVRFDPLDGWR